MNERHLICTFRVDGMLFGIKVDQVQEIIRRQETTRVPLASPVVRGLINLRGQIVAAIDMRRRLERADFPARIDPTNVVIRTPDGPFSLLVDEIGDVVEVDAECYEPAPETVRGEMRELIRGAYKLKGQLLLALDVDATIRGVARTASSEGTASSNTSHPRSSDR